MGEISVRGWNKGRFTFGYLAAREAFTSARVGSWIRFPGISSVTGKLGAIGRFVDAEETVKETMLEWGETDRS